MTRQDKLLLIQDLCARLPHGVKFHYYPEFADGEDTEFDNTIAVIDVADEQILDEDHEDYISISQISPYLRPISSMTEEEQDELKRLGADYLGSEGLFSWATEARYGDFWFNILVWLNEHHFDYRGLIEKGLALEAPEGTYYGIN